MGRRERLHLSTRSGQHSRRRHLPLRRRRTPAAIPVSRARAAPRDMAEGNEGTGIPPGRADGDRVWRAHLCGVLSELPQCVRLLRSRQHRPPGAMGLGGLRRGGVVRQPRAGLRPLGGVRGCDRCRRHEVPRCTTSRRAATRRRAGASTSSDSRRSSTDTDGRYRGRRTSTWCSRCAPSAPAASTSTARRSISPIPRPRARRSGAFASLSAIPARKRCRPISPAIWRTAVRRTNGASRSSSRRFISADAWRDATTTSGKRSPTCATSRGLPRCTAARTGPSCGAVARDHPSRRPTIRPCRCRRSCSVCWIG